MDTFNKWLEAFIIDTSEDKVKVHYKGYTAKWEEWIERDSDRLQVIGEYTGAYGWRFYQKQEDDENDGEQDQTLKAELKQKEIKFNRDLATKKMGIVEVGGDGNCLFRSFAHQLYGDEEHHRMIRKMCMDYIEIEKEFYSSYIIGAEQNMDQYIDAKRKNGVWGDDVEI